ncbi:NAD(P)-dependent oxidoreductase [Microbulbifer sp. YPW1]|uniref:NAD(P)-dependent oxidoreductase n=1 Tax=Microbulbifer sp. YPW1 TaxID=2745199 RepID=UPI0015974AFA|nr:NAD(P)-dependent oxidoreductase [Microbulbifer sp. YPW1]QKX18678.1 NAD(P)-dependent oxidoreductase [Microbulbifer sp. YPW1]
MTTTVAFIGLGVMGFPMAGYLSRAGYRVQIYNRTGSRASEWLETYAGEAFTTPAKAASGAEFVFACVGNDDDLRQVTTGSDGAFHGMASGSVFVDHTTASANVARELAAAAAERGIGFLDAPVSGGQAGAENGALTIMVGGDEANYQRVTPLLNSYARALNLMGPVGSGQLCKMVNQVCIAGLVQGLSEGLHFARAAGLDPEQVVEVISKGAAQSWQMENRYKTMLAGDYEHGFAVDWMRKDLGIVLDEAQRNGALLPVTALVDQFYSEVQALGGGRWDTSSLFARLTNLRDFENSGS